MNKRRKILAAMLAAFMLLVPMVSTAQIDIKGDGGETSDLSGTWGTMQITDYQPEEYVPLGEGLWLLAGAAGLYLLVKSRKTRKATAVTAAALALTLGTTQCKKTEESVIPAEESVIPAGETISISFMAGNGAKSGIDVNTGLITWEENDKVYVVYEGQLLSATPLSATPDPENLVNATISGTITTAVTIGENPEFTFYYVGSGVTFDKTNFTFDIKNQDGIHAGHYMVGRTEAVEMKVKEGTENSYVPTQDGAKHFDPLTSVLRLNTEAFETNKTMTTMKMSCGNNLMTINLAGDATPSYTAGSITFTGGDDVQISVIPTTTPDVDANVTLSFSGNGKVGSITVTNGIKAGRIYSKVTNNAGYPIHVETIDGALPGLFSVSDTKLVYFSQGNLQYKASNSTWRFAENQYEVMGEGNKNVGPSYGGYIDLFGWGTSGYDHGATKYHPYDISAYNTSNQYYAYGNRDMNLADCDGKADWGYNKIENGGNVEDGGWFTLSKSEWDYIFNERKDASNLYRFGVKVDNVSNCLVIAPDGESNPSSSYTADAWKNAQKKGYVCFPPTGARTSGESTPDVINYWTNGDYGYYWLSSATGDSDSAWRTYFKGSYIQGQGEFFGGSSSAKGARYQGFSVRLVRYVN